jgi:S-adenosylmethionine uptake transporter
MALHDSFPRHDRSASRRVSMFRSGLSQLSPNAKGALLMVLGMAAFTMNDAAVKMAGNIAPLFQIIALRGLIATAFLLALAVATGVLRFDFARRDWALLALRSLGEIGATFFFLSALMVLPLADLTAILQMLPLTVTLGAALFFREKIGWRRMLAILAGFCGMLLIVRPGPEGLSLPGLYGLAAVGCVTMRDLVTRKVSAQVPSLMVTLTGSVTVLLFAMGMSLRTEWVPMDMELGGLILIASVLIMVAYGCSVAAMRVGDVSAVAPFRYSGLAVALVIDYAFFSTLPDMLSLVGAAIIVAAGLFTLIRERVRPEA